MIIKESEKNFPVIVSVISLEPSWTTKLEETKNPYKVFYEVLNSLKQDKRFKVNENHCEEVKMPKPARVTRWLKRILGIN